MVRPITSRSRSGADETKAPPQVAPLPTPVVEAPAAPEGPIDVAARLAASVKDASACETLARDLVAADDTDGVGMLVKSLDESPHPVEAGKTLEAIAAASPKALGPHTDGIAAALRSPNGRTTTVASSLLASAAPAVPARVAKHLDGMLKTFPIGAPSVRDALVRAFSGLCAASVAYQRRLGPVLEEALATCAERDLPRWAEVILPSLKGEPHARARAIVERRMPELARPGILRVAKLLGVKPPRAAK